MNPANQEAKQAVRQQGGREMTIPVMMIIIALMCVFGAVRMVSENF